MKIVLLAALVFGLAIAGAKLRGRDASVQAAEFNKLVEAGKPKAMLDLRGFYPGAWDELVVWLPYGNICAYGIKGYEPNSLHCRSSTDDSDCQLIFLRKNELAFMVPIDRRKIDLTTLENKGNRIPRKSAVFVFETPGEFPKMMLAN